MMDTRCCEVGLDDRLPLGVGVVPMEEEASGSCDGRGRYGSYNRSRRAGYDSALQSPLHMATTPPLSPEQLEIGEARCKAEFSRVNTWDRIAATRLYAVSLWKLSQEIFEEKIKDLTDGPVGKLKVH